MARAIDAAHFMSVHAGLSSASIATAGAICYDLEVADEAEEAARRARYSARHRAHEAAIKPVAPPKTPVEVSVAQKMWRAARRIVPQEVKDSAAAFPVKLVIRWARRRLRPAAPPRAASYERPAWAQPPPVIQPSTDPSVGGLRIAIKVPAPSLQVAPMWGDYHFALALQRSFSGRGHLARIDLLPDWQTPRTPADDVVLVLRGLSSYRPGPGAVNLIWNISHPEKITDAELDTYDHVFVASTTYAQQLSRQRAPVSPLLQCTDHAIFYPKASDSGDQRVLFVGNSRRRRRPIVLDAIAAGLPLDVYGSLWEGLIPAEYIRGQHIDNVVLRDRYANAGVVLNDHWASMRDLGFISNRLFDAAASGAVIVSDPAAGLEAVFGDAIPTYETVAELKALVTEALSKPDLARARARDLARVILAEHTFDHRAEEILRVATMIRQKKRLSA